MALMHRYRPLLNELGHVGNAVGSGFCPFHPAGLPTKPSKPISIRKQKPHTPYDSHILETGPEPSNVKLIKMKTIAKKD